LLLPKINKKRRKWDFKWANRRPGKGLMLSVTKCGWGEVAKPHFDSTIQKGMKHWEPPLGGKIQKFMGPIILKVCQ